MNRPVPFIKTQSIGNDFVLMMASDVMGLDLSELTIRMCEPRFGVGADSSLVLQVDSRSHLTLWMFNADGTPDFCGNGLRCAIDYAWQEGWIESELDVTHLGREVHATVTPQTSTFGAQNTPSALFLGLPPTQVVPPSAPLIATTLGLASYEPSDVPLATAYGPFFLSELDGRVLSSVSTGTTHTVILVDELPGDPDFEVASRALEHHPAFPDRTSVMWTQVLGQNHLKLRIWERGVGETLGCGSGSTAAAAVYLRREHRGGRVQVDNPGGTVFVEAENWDQPLTISGTAHISFRGVLQ